MSLVPYPGLIPSIVNKDAKYSVVHADDGMQVQLRFTLNHKEKAILTTDRHDQLVEMVNAVKQADGSAPGGAFYLNEYFDVLVPTMNGCFFAGSYENVLVFDLDGATVSPHRPPGVEPGDEWSGPHVGIPYVLAAGGQDIYYKTKSGKIERREDLSDHVGATAAAKLAGRLAAIRGTEGGRIYINECGEFFAPPRAGSTGHVYLGGLDEDAWFPAPDVPRD